MGRSVAAASAVLASFLTVVSAHAASTIWGAGLSASVDPSGSYSVIAWDPAWVFSGDIGHPLSNISVASGADAAGGYSEVSFDFQTAVSLHAAIHVYSGRPAILFTLKYPGAAANTLAFPTLTAYPQGLRHINFYGHFSITPPIHS